MASGPTVVEVAMAVLGSLPLEVLDSGIAQLLVKPPKTKQEFNYRRATFRAAPDTPFIICCFSGRAWPAL
jgi:hypothetical protein